MLASNGIVKTLKNVHFYIVNFLKTCRGRVKNVLVFDNSRGLGGGTSPKCLRWFDTFKKFRKSLL